MPQWPKLVAQEWFWGKTEPWRTLHFKRLPWGWLFRSPICWGPFGVGPHAHYILSDAQQAEVESAFRDVNWRTLGVVLLIALAGMPLLWFGRTLSQDFELGLLIGVAFYTLYVQLVLNGYWWLTFRGVLADAPRTRERIGFAERYRALAASMPSKGLAYAAVICAVLAGGEVHTFLTAKGLGAMSLVGVILFGAIAIACIVTLLVKRRART
jgi:hypothetical protein